MLSRVATLERERDDVGKREVEIRRKARESVGFPISTTFLVNS